MLSQEEATNDHADEIDNKPHTKHTANSGIGSLIPVNNFHLGADDAASTLATQETLAKNLVYITKIPDGKMDRTKTTQDSSKNSGEQDRKQSSLLENPDQVTSNDKLNVYGESESDTKMKKGEERKTNTWRTRKIIHMEFELDDDEAEQSKNANHAKKEGKVRVTKKTVHYYEFSSEEEEGAHADPKKIKKTHDDHENPSKIDENDQALVSVENPNTRLILISCSQGILSSSSLSCYLLLRLLVYMYLSQLMRTFTNYLKCIVISP